MSKPNRISRVLLAPFRALGRVRDFYVRNITACAGNMNTGGYGYYDSYHLPRNFSTTSDRAGGSREQDLAELIRAASQKHNQANGVNGMPPRSRSVAVGRIDEDAPFDASAGALDVGSNLLFPRSRSYAPGGSQGKAFARSIV